VSVGMQSGTGGTGTRERGGWSRRQWLAVAALAVGITATAVAVPPLITAWSNGDTPSPVGAPRVPANAGPVPSTGASAAPPPTATASAAGPDASRTDGSSHGPQPGALTPIRIAATSSGNNLYGSAEAITCLTCASGSRVRYIGGEGGVVVNVPSVPSAGDRNLTVFYESDGPRTFEISVNGAAPLVQHLSGKGDWVTPAWTTVTITLPAGDSVIRFSNPAGAAPDLDEIVIS
jgi:hypothetical protein